MSGIMCSSMMISSIAFAADNNTDIDVQEPIVSDSGLIENGIIAPMSAADSSFNFKFKAIGGKWTTPGRPKDNTTATYIWCNGTYPSGGMRVYVMGNSTDYEYDSFWVDCTKGAAYLTTNQKRAITQYVKERDYKYAQLKGAKYGSGTVASGVWSPDSSGTYPRIN